DNADGCKWARGHGKMSGRRNAAWSGLQSTYAGEVSRHANRSTAVTACARSDRRRFAATGATGRAIQVPGIVASAVKQIVGLPRHQELRGVSCAQDDCAGILQPCDKRSILLRNKPSAQAGPGLAAEALHGE